MKRDKALRDFLIAEPLIEKYLNALQRIEQANLKFGYSCNASNICSLNITMVFKNPKEFQEKEPLPYIYSPLIFLTFAREDISNCHIKWKTRVLIILN
jgi:hypothetical protein